MRQLSIHESQAVSGADYNEDVGMAASTILVAGTVIDLSSKLGTGLTSATTAIAGVNSSVAITTATIVAPALTVLIPVTVAVGTYAYYNSSSVVSK